MDRPSSWLSLSPDSDFSLFNLPYGVFRPHATASPRVATRLGDWVVDLHALQQHGYLAEVVLPPGIFDRAELNGLISLGKPVWRRLRQRLQALFDGAAQGGLRHDAPAQQACLHQADAVEMLLPLQVGDYTDFYASEYHATNVGTMFRGKDRALQPNWKHLPVGYHGRASSLLVSGQPVRRPLGQLKLDAGPPCLGPSQALDFELEVAWVIGAPNEWGRPIPLAEAEDHIFGLVLFNDWSARDIQRWEYVPLGPFLGKSFASSLSPWVVPLEALEPFRCAGPVQSPPVLPYLQSAEPGHFDIELEVALALPGQAPVQVCRSNFRHLYWSMAQMVAHHSINGCNLRTGDVMASGTISGPEVGSYGSLLEITWGGNRRLELPGASRHYLEDGDEVWLRGFARKEGLRVGFGELRSQVWPAPSTD